MDWLKIGSSLADHPRVLRLSDRAFRVYIAALCYSARHETDGVVPVMEDDRQAYGELVKAGLGEPRDGVTNGGGVEFQVYKWEKWNPTKARLDAEREAGRRRQARFRKRNAGNNASSNGGPNSVVPGTEVEVEREEEVDETDSKARSAPNALSNDQAYLLEKLRQAKRWQPLSFGAVVKLNKQYGRGIVHMALQRAVEERDTVEFTTGPYPLLEAMAKDVQRIQGEA